MKAFAPQHDDPITSCALEFRIIGVLYQPRSFIPGIQHGVLIQSLLFLVR